MNELMENVTANTTTYVNHDLESATKKILKIGDSIKTNLYEVAYIIAQVDSTECYKEDGFNNVHEWTNKTFGFKKTASYSLLKIGKEYTLEEIITDKNGKRRGVKYQSNLPHVEGEDFSTTQITCLLPLGREEVNKVTDEKLVTPEMSCAEIKKFVKKYTEEMNETEEDDYAEDHSSEEDFDNEEVDDARGQALEQILNGIDVLIETETDEKEKQNMEDIKEYFDNLTFLRNCKKSLF